MAARPNGFIIFTEDLDKTKRLSDADFRQWITACIVYAQSGEIIDLPDMAALCFDFVKDRIDLHTSQYEKQCTANRENGKKGGRPPKAKETQQNQVGFSETQRNPQNPNIKNKIQNTKPKEKNIKNKIQTLSEGMRMEEDRGCGGKERPTDGPFCSEPWKPLAEDEFERQREQRLEMLGLFGEGR